MKIRIDLLTIVSLAILFISIGTYLEVGRMVAVNNPMICSIDTIIEREIELYIKGVVQETGQDYVYSISIATDDDIKSEKTFYEEIDAIDCYDYRNRIILERKNVPIFFWYWLIGGWVFYFLGSIIVNIYKNKTFNCSCCKLRKRPSPLPTVHVPSTPPPMYSEKI